jgi:methionyl-tRNA synthetase
MATVLYVLADVVRVMGFLVQAIMPASGAKMLDQLVIDEDKRSFDSIEIALVPGTPLPAPQGVFPRYVVEEGAA